MVIPKTRPWKVIFADGSFTVADARSKYEAIQIAKGRSKLTTVDAEPITETEASRLEKIIYGRKNPELKIMTGDFWQRLPNNEHIKRGLEIAIAGNHSVIIIIPPQTQRMYVEFSKHLPMQILIAFRPSGRYTDAQVERYLRRIKLWNYDIALEGVVPRARDYEYIGEPFKNAKERISRMAHYKKFEIDESANYLLKMGKEKMKVDIEISVRVARTIANLENSEIIMAQHIAEAMQYQSLFSEYR